MLQVYKVERHWSSKNGHIRLIHCCPLPQLSLYSFSNIHSHSVQTVICLPGSISHRVFLSASMLARWWLVMEASCLPWRRGVMWRPDRGLPRPPSRTPRLVNQMAGAHIAQIKHRGTPLTFYHDVICMFPPVRQLHREFLRSGANVMQTFTFYSSDDKLENRGQTLKYTVSVQLQGTILKVFHNDTLPL